MTETIDPGTAHVSPAGPFTAGSRTTVTFTYTAGHPVDDTGCIKITFRNAGDFGIPQFTEPSAPDYCSVHTDGDCIIEPRWDPKGHTRPWSKALYLKIMKGFLDTGKTITVVFGDTSLGSSGWRIQTFCEKTFEFKTFADPIATYEFKELPSSPVLEIIPGPPVKAVAIAPSYVQSSTQFTYYLKLEDRWGNPVEKPRRLIHTGFAEPGIYRIEAEDEAAGFQALSNPVRAADPLPEQFPCWADFHAQSEETVGTGSIEDYFTFARDSALLDITGHQGNDFQITDPFWKMINTAADEFYEPGSFVTFPGYEWSGNTPLGGDRNVYFGRTGGELSRSSLDLVPGKTSKYPVTRTAGDLFAHLKSQADSDPFVFAHVGGRYADISIHEEDIEIAMEVHSAWGTFEWLVHDALDRGFRIGICANSDGHTCRPGASYPGARKFGSYGGLTCVLSPGLTREEIVRALKSRRFYATTGNRPLLDVRVRTDRTAHAFMGNAVTAHSDIVLTAEYSGTAPVEYIEIMNGRDTVHTEYADGEHSGTRFKVMWKGSEVRGRARAVPWDGYIRVKGNTVSQALPVNFWNPDLPLRKTDSSTFEFSSITTGGLAGVILTVEHAGTGRLEFVSAQKNITCDINDITREPLVWECGGIDKAVHIYTLPDTNRTFDVEFTHRLKNLKKGVNPLYIKAVQEDGHTAWSSPVYVHVE